MQQYDVVYVIEQNRDAQMCALLQLELQIDPARLRSVLNYDGMPITADRITEHIQQQHVHSTAAQ
jgi:2-oxoglutarate ferredoxin oxidoreductase subunit alpha